MPTKAFDYMMLMVTLEAVFENTQVSTQRIWRFWPQKKTKSESILQNPIFQLTPEFEGTLKDEIRKHESHDNLHDYKYFDTNNENYILAKWFLKTELFQKRLIVNKIKHNVLINYYQFIYGVQCCTAEKCFLDPLPFIGFWAAFLYFTLQTNLKYRHFHTLNANLYVCLKLWITFMYV